MRMTLRWCLLVGVGMMLMGCGTETFDVAFPDAVTVVTSYYPTVDTTQLDPAELEKLVQSNPAFSDEGADGMTMTVSHGESVDEQEYRILIEKQWPDAPARLTAITLVSQDEYFTNVTVLSEREMLIGGYMRDWTYESDRLAEVRQVLGPLERTLGAE